MDKIFTARDRGHVEEIKNLIKQMQRVYKNDYSDEIEWLDNLEKRFI